MPLIRSITFKMTGTFNQIHVVQPIDLHVTFTFSQRTRPWSYPITISNSIPSIIIQSFNWDGLIRTYYQYNGQLYNMSEER